MAVLKVNLGPGGEDVACHGFALLRVVTQRDKNL